MAISRVIADGAGSIALSILGNAEILDSGLVCRLVSRRNCAIEVALKYSVMNEARLFFAANDLVQVKTPQCTRTNTSSLKRLLAGKACFEDTSLGFVSTDDGDESLRVPVSKIDMEEKAGTKRTWYLLCKCQTR
jgi:hypothetical protein